MSDAPQIILTIARDGSLKSEVKGVSGPKCTDMTAWVKQLGQVTADRETDDYYKDDGQETRVSG